ncbi:MAG TPA: cysteine hydrolase family protein [Methylobacterium sp.]|jgi:nicotinamidase-related amidase|uniref:cysteine hydrolase family protein n=1 Tax=Methylorubrum sp. B1-46 TaxID=2897334 RepID=UPI001E58CD46|nr:cysteine hydrolase family protein [Methylorubrum sp. B1-46]UGB23855.1 cysteine hydrolase [Methylorubrum sp. B1-46]HEV2541127.1 cysteine hydrolase family protein [Methylobacterium sp.]
MPKLLLAAAILAASTSLATPRTLLEIAGVEPPPLVPERAALVIIDAQQEYRSGVLPLTAFEPAVAHIVKLRGWARAHRVPVIHVQHVTKTGSAAFAAGSPGADFVPELAPAPGETVIVKRLPNSFAGTDLDAVLRREGRTSLILTGFMTHMCVEATARTALDHAYTSFVVADATATRDLTMPGGETLGADEVKRNALAAVADRFGWIIASERLIGR